MQLLDITNSEQAFLLAILLLWVLPWKGYALWRSAKNDDKKWFIALFVVNTLAILDIIYIFIIDKKRKAQKINGEQKIGN